MHLNGIGPDGQDLLHHRPAHLRDGDQDGADAHSDPDLALGLHRLGRRSRAPGRADPDRPRQGQALRRARRRASASSSTAIPRPSRKSTARSRARRASPRTRREDRRRAARRRASRGAWAAATRRCGCSPAAAPRPCHRARRGRRSRRWCSTPMAIRRALPTSACRWSPTASPDFAGPLAGVLAGLDWAAEQLPGLHPCRQLRDRCAVPAARPRGAAGGGDWRAGADLACAASGGQAHPVFGLWPVRLRDDLRRAVEEGMRKVDVWTARYRLARWSSRRPVDPFFNANRPEDLAASLLASSASR